MQPEKAMEAITKYLESEAVYSIMDHPMNNKWTWKTFIDKKPEEIIGVGNAMFENRDWKAYISYPIVPYPDYRVEVFAGDNYKFKFIVDGSFKVISFVSMTLQEDKDED